MGLIFLKSFKVGMFFLISISFISCKSYQKIGGKNSNYIPYYLKVYEADSLFLVKNYSSAYEKYDSLFKHYEPINMPLYFEFENYIKSGLLAKKDKSFKKEFKTLFTNYGYTYGNIEEDTLLQGLALRFKKSKKDIEKWQKKYSSKLDTSYRYQLTLMNFNDQKVRNQKPLNWDEVAKIDKQNDSLLRQLINVIGYPNFKNVGSFRKLNESERKVDLGVEVLLNHFTSSSESFEFYNQILPYFVKKGECLPKDYAHLIDRYNTKKSKDSFFYFISFNYDFKNNPSLVKIINERRKKYGLPSIEYEKIWFEERLMKI